MESVLIFLSRPSPSMPKPILVEFMGGPWDGLEMLMPPPGAYLMLGMENNPLRQAVYRLRGASGVFSRYDFVEMRTTKARKSQSSSS